MYDPPSTRSVLWDQLDSEQRSEGLATLKRWQRALLARFERFGVGVSLVDAPSFDAHIERLGIGHLRPRLGLAQSQGHYADVASFVDAVRVQASRNPLLVALAAACADERGCPWSDRELVDAVYFCFLLDVLGRALMLETVDTLGPGQRLLLVELRDALRERRSIAARAGAIDLSSRIKLAALERPFATHTKRKLDPSLLHAPLSTLNRCNTWLNILWAMHEDVVSGWLDNPTAALELLIEADGAEPFEPALENPSRGPWMEPDADGQPRSLGVQLYHPPLPLDWVNLYQSWDMAFGCNFAATPMFFAKLLTPVVAGTYQHTPGAYMMPRLVCLYVYAHAETLRRVDTQAGATWRENRIPSITARWGAINLRAAKAYTQAVEARAGTQRLRMRARRRALLTTLWSFARALGHGRRRVAGRASP